jgi:hypothetical protein
MSRPDEGLIHQWLDGECTPEESARLEQLVATDAEWAAAVAEARGLIAASTRIVGALDAVPRAMPTAGARPASASTAPGRSLRMPAWIGVAAGVVLVAGTAYVLREQSAAPFGAVATSVPQPAPTGTAPAEQVVRDVRAADAPRNVPPAPVASPASGAPGASPASAGVDAAPPSAPLPPQPTAPEPVRPQVSAVPRAEAEADARRSEIAVGDRSRRAPSRQAVLAGEAPASEAPAARATPVTLDGCWRVTAPPDLAGVLVQPVIRRSAGDTLVLVTVRGEVTVVRTGDVLRGGLDAKQEPCRAPE